MKSIVLVALLAAGCSEKPKEPEGPNCAGSITKGIDKMAQTIKARGAQLNPQMLEMMQGVMTKLQATLTTRCTEDKWPAEALPCFETITGQPEMRKCLDKLPPELHTKAQTAIRETMMSGMRPGMNHPPAMGGSGAPAPMMAGSAAPPPVAPPAAGSAGSAAAGSGSAAGW